MSNNVSNFYIKEWYNSSHDVTWSFQYNLSGNNKTDGGFTTFLALSTAVPQNNVGGGGASLGIGPKGVINKINGTVFCIAIDSTGLFGTRNTFSTGNTNPIPNSMIVRINNDLQFLTAFSLGSVGLSGLNTNDAYNTIRINYTNVGQTLNIAKLNSNNEYETFYTYTGQFEKETSSPVRIGFSHTSPIIPTSLKSRLTLKDIHTQGRYVYPKYNLLYENIYDEDGNLIGILDENGDPISDDLLNKEPLVDELIAETDSYLKVSPINLNLNLSKESKLDGSLAINFEGNNNPINIIIHPQSKYVINNSDVTLKVLAESNKKLSYQWYSNDIKVLGQTSSTYIIPQITSDKSVYCLVSTSDGETVASETAIIIVANKPIIYKNLSSQSIVDNSSITLSVSAQVTAPLTYEWYVNDVLVPNSNYFKYRLKNVTSTKNVYCIIKNIAGSTKSKTAAITIAIPPTITTQPTSVESGTNQTVIYTISAIGTEPLTYKWYSNNIIVPNLNQNTYTFNSGNTTKSTKFKSIYCKVSNIAGTVSSNIASYNVVFGPTIKIQPSNIIRKSGDSAVFSVSAISNSPITYQWYDSGIIIPSATLSSYTISNATINKTFYCLLTDSAGSVRTNNTSLIIEQLPLITKQPLSFYINSGSNCTFNITANSLTPLNYKWYVNDIELLGSNSDTLHLTNITNNKTIYCKLSNLAGETQSNIVSATIASSVGIVTQPISVDIDRFTSTTFNIYVSGTPPINYQWYGEDTLAETETASSYTITNATFDLDDVYCVVSNKVNSVTSNKVYMHLYREPIILATSPNITATIGSSNTTVSVTAIGGQPITYQWYSGNNLIIGANLSSYTIPNLTTNMGLSCVISNRIASITSDMIDIVATGTIQNNVPALTDLILTSTSTTSGSNVITTSSTDGLTIGSSITGPGIPVGAVITKIINSTTFEISVPANETTTNQTATTTKENKLDSISTIIGSNLITTTSTDGLVVGMTITGNGIPDGAIITKIIDSTTFEISVPANATGSINQTTSINNINTTIQTTNGSNLITTTSTDGLTIGMTITGNGIPAGATITKIIPPNSFEISVPANATATTTNSKANLYQLTNYNSVYLDGDSYAMMNNNSWTFNPSESAFTLEYWIYAPQYIERSSGYVISPYVGSMGILDLAIPSNLQETMSAEWTLGPLADNTVQFFYISSNNVWVTNITSTETVKLSTWNHIAAVQSDTDFKLFVNGIGRTFDKITNSSDSNRINIGKHYNAAAVSGTYISNLRLVVGQALYSSNFTPTSEPLTISSQGALPKNVKLLTLQNELFEDVSMYKNTLTGYNGFISNKKHPFQNLPFKFTITVTSP